MMLAIFAALFLALLAGWFGHSRIGLALLMVCLGLSIGLFLFEIYSPQTGFRMPWLQTDLGAPVPRGREA